MGIPGRTKRAVQRIGRQIAANTVVWIGVFLILHRLRCCIAFIWNTEVSEHPRMERLGWWSQAIAAVVAILAAFLSPFKSPT
jgi:hypothetical protein